MQEDVAGGLEAGAAARRAAFRARADRATRMGSLFVGSAVTGVDTSLRDEHQRRILRDLGGPTAALRVEAAAFIRDLRSALIRQS